MIPFFDPITKNQKIQSLSVLKNLVGPGLVHCYNYSSPLSSSTRGEEFGLRMSSPERGEDIAEGTVKISVYILGGRVD